MKRGLLSLAVLAALSSGCSQPTVDNASKAGNAGEDTNVAIWPKLNSPVVPSAEIEQRIDTLMSDMTVEQKVAQIIQPEIRDISIDDMRRYGFGSFLNGGGAYPNNDKQATIEDWVRLAEQLYQASIDDSLDGSSIPTMWGTDAVHGHNNVIGATIFPHNIGLGAARDPGLIERIAEATSVEVQATGIDWIFAPTVATVRDDRWGRTYESYSEDPAIVRDYAAAIVKGLQGTNETFLADNKVISTVKHFVGDGGTQNGIDQGNNIDDEQTLFDVHAQGYIGGLNAGAQTVMASFNSWNGQKIHGSKYLLTDVLKSQMGFDGFVVGDWNGHGQIPGCSNDSCPQAINAGLDVFMAPTASWRPLFDNTVAQVNDGTIPMARLDDAVRRVLRVKLRANLFDKPSPAQRPYAGNSELIGAKSHRAVAREAVRKSLVLLKNNQQVLPINPTKRILVAGDGADNIGKQSGGWTITWQGTNNLNSDFPGATSIYQGLAEQVEAAGGTIALSADGSFNERPDVAIVVFGEEPYAEGVGDLTHLNYGQLRPQDIQLLQSLKDQEIPVVSVFISGRPLWVNPELNASDAFVAAWLPGSEGAGVADVLLTDQAGEVQHDFTGKLSFSWPSSPLQQANVGDSDYDPLFAYGYGLSYAESIEVSSNLPEDVGNLSKNTDTMVYDRQTHPSLNMTLISGEDSAAVIANSQTLGSVSFRTLDRNLQEDAFLVRFDGKGTAGVRFDASSAFGFKVESPAEGHFSGFIKRDGLLTSIRLQLLCTNKGCGFDQDISDLLNQAADQQWTQFSIDGECLNVSDATITRALQLSSVKANSLALSELGFTKQQSDVHLSCK